ncbi:MAG: PQQ-dependent sugar dehydrogenase [Actinomycetota bacterium]|nr:PQQ-dependent sugar dehydrogenase [Actinomycetota bacterium]
MITGLQAPTSFTVDPNGDSIWYAERASGEIRRRNLSNGQDTLVTTIPDVLSAGEEGLFGVALHPAYPSTQLLYAFATRSTGFGPVNQVFRITLSGGVGVAQRSIFNDAQTPTDGHVGGRIPFGPDGMLYVTLGETGCPATPRTST